LSEDAVALLGWTWSVEEGIVFSWVLFKWSLVDQRNYLVATIGCPSCLSSSLLCATTAASKNEVEEAPAAFACLGELVLLPVFLPLTPCRSWRLRRHVKVLHLLEAPGVLRSATGIVIAWGICRIAARRRAASTTNILIKVIHALILREVLELAAHRFILINVQLLNNVIPVYCKDYQENQEDNVDHSCHSGRVEDPHEKKG